MSVYPRGIREVDPFHIRRCDPRARVFLSDLEALDSPAALMTALSAEDRERASRFLSPPAASSFVRRRWLRRVLLATVEGVDAADIDITSDRLGRPRIVAPSSLQTLSLSTSSAGRYALVAWSPSGPIGVDIAHVNTAHATVDAARVFMSPAELDAWQLDGGGAERFFECWTRKEAILKARGTGFATDPTTVEAMADTQTVRLPAPQGWVAAFASRTLNTGPDIPV